MSHWFIKFGLDPELIDRQLRTLSKVPPRASSSGFRRLKLPTRSCDHWSSRLPYFRLHESSRSGDILSWRRSTLPTPLADRGNTPSDVQPTVFLKEVEKVIAVGDLARDDLFFPLIISNREGKLHRLIGRILFGKVDEFYVEGCWFLSLSLHSDLFPRP